jgi:hypothetical protein
VADIFGFYEGIGNSLVDERYHAVSPKVEAVTVRGMSPEEIAKYGAPTMQVTPRIRGFEQLNKDKGRGKRGKTKG